MNRIHVYVYCNKVHKIKKITWEIANRVWKHLLLFMVYYENVLLAHSHLHINDNEGYLELMEEITDCLGRF